MGEQMQKYAPNPTDYSDESNWLAQYKHGMDADTFYLYPTLGHERFKDLFCGADDKQMRYHASSTMPIQLVPWLWDTNVYAPAYRQASFLGLAQFQTPDIDRTETHEALEAFLREEAMDDIYAALDYFFEHKNEGRPFFLVSHSQGSMLMKIVLEDYRAMHPERFEKMIAAYCPGWSFTQEWCDRVGLPFAKGSSDTGVLISWNCERPSSRNTFNEFSRPGALCINPLNWTMSEDPSEVSDSKGSLVFDKECGAIIERSIISAYMQDSEDDDSEAEGSLQDSIAKDNSGIKVISHESEDDMVGVVWSDPREVMKLWSTMRGSGERFAKSPFIIKPNLVVAWYRPERGMLWVDCPFEFSFTPRILGKRSLHMMEIPMFFENIRQNVAERIDAWHAAH